MWIGEASQNLEAALCNHDPERKTPVLQNFPTTKARNETENSRLILHYVNVLRRGDAVDQTRSSNIARLHSTARVWLVNFTKYTMHVSFVFRFGEKCQTANYPRASVIAFQVVCVLCAGEDQMSKIQWSRDVGFDPRKRSHGEQSCRWTIPRRVQEKKFSNNNSSEMETKPHILKISSKMIFRWKKFCRKVWR